jgi:Ca2+-binding RTX toxin-like protein
MVAHAVLNHLESRRLLSATALLHNGLLTVRGDATGANTINVAFSSDQSAVDVSIHSVAANGNATNYSHAFSGVHSVAVLGGVQADTINVGQSGLTFNLATYVNGGSGNDSITTGAENDIIDGGPGADTINAGDGNNIVRGQGGYDYITTGSGNDSINAGPGNDTVYAGAGDDVIVGSSGNDYLDGGDGNDTIYAGKGDDSLLGDAGNDVLWGNGGHDYINGGDGNDTLGGIAQANILLGGAGQDTFIIDSLLKNPNNDYTPGTDILKIYSRNGNFSQTPPKI